VATTLNERKLPIAGEWVETGEWLEVRSPYSGEVVARVAKGGADETCRAIDAAAEAMKDPLPAQSAPRSSSESQVRSAAVTTRSHASSRTRPASR